MKKSLKLDVRIDIKPEEEVKVSVDSRYSPEEDFVAKVKKAVEELVKAHPWEKEP